ncbi:MAG: DUF2892 domain-containing protein [Bacteroidetes bacterium]|nr:DUF2892 domain-containing protein [Bacteroidota bacterium]
MEKLDISDTSVNVGELERTQSLITGTLFLLSGINSIGRHPVAASLKTLIGGYLIYRSVTGHCHLNQMMERNSAKD